MASKKRKQRRRSPLLVQSLIFKKSKFSKKRAKNWARSHGFSHTAIDEKLHTYRIRQLEPTRMNPNSYATVSFGNSGIAAAMATTRGRRRKTLADSKARWYLDGPLPP